MGGVLSTGSGVYPCGKPLRGGVRVAIRPGQPLYAQIADALRAEALGIPAGEEVVVRARVLRAEGGPPIGSAVSHFPAWVVDAAPALADPNVSGLPGHLRTAFGPTYSEDLVDCRMPTAEERDQLEIPESTPVLIIKGTTRDQQHRTLHFIDKVTVAGRMSYGYKFGDVPT